MVRQRQRNKDGGPIRSVFYLRMSTDKQDLSIGGQRYHLLQFVESDESNDRVVVGEYIDEGITGSTASRTNFQRMMADATGPNPPLDEVIIYDLSRFSRDTVDSLTYPRILQAHGIGFHSVKDNFSSDASGRLHMTLIAGVNEFHNYKTAEGSSRGQADATRMGYYTAPRAPLGFLKERVTVGGKEHSILVIEPEKAPLVQRIFGMTLQGQTPLDIAKTLNAEGIPSSTGNTWGSTVIHAMLHNVRYAGTGCHGKQSHSKFLFNSTVTLVPNAHPAIVSQETFDKVQEILTSRRFSPSDPESKHPRRAASPFLLSNLVYCKCCGKKMFVRNSGKDRRKLACSTNRTRGAGACPTRPEDMEVVSTTVLRALLKKVLTENNLRQVVQKVGEDSKNFAERQDRECETIIVKLEDIKTQKNNIIQAIAREGRHIPDLATYLDGLSQEQAGLEARKVGLDTERNALQAFLSDELRIIENASRVRTYLQSEERSVVMSMIESFVKKVELNNGSVTIHYSIPMPPGGNGKKGWSETLPLNGDQWPMETPAGAQIVLSAGAIASPQLLMLSGVGSESHLQSLGIPVVKSLPGVGQNLRDHPLVPIRVSVKDGFPLDPDAPRIQVVLRYTAGGSDHRNDMQIFPSSFSTPLGGDPFAEEGIRLTCMMELAVSSGELRLASVDPNVQPFIDCRYLEEPWDRERMREGIRIALKLMEHEAFRNIVDNLISPTDHDLASDEALDSWMMENVWIGQHLSGTCKMGPSNDPMAVVDQYCRVHGLEGLWVADASIMPDVIRANTNATTIMIGERVADWIAAELGQST